MTNTEAKSAGHGAGFEDACNWIVDEQRDLRTEDTRDSSAEEMLADKLRAALKDPVGADEGLINALTSRELDEQMGFAARGADGEWTSAAQSWFEGYNAGWRSAVEDRLAELVA